MKYAHLMTLLLLIAPVSGCGKIVVSNYCDIASPLYFSEETLIWLSENDRSFLTDTVVANEKWNALCN
jgi:hypothetical protein